MENTSSSSTTAPNFEYLQQLIQDASAALPTIGQWVAPTLSLQELEKRIQELRTVQFWLEQNAHVLETTIQALQVQCMTLSTLKAMNVPMDTLRMSLKIPEPSVAKEQAATRNKSTGNADSAAAVDPMQWWTTLAAQFAQITGAAMKNTSPTAAQASAHAMPKQPPATERASKRAPHTVKKTATSKRKTRV